MYQSLQAKVSSIIHHDSWRWPRLRNRATQLIIRHTPMDFLPASDREDQVIWTPHSGGSYTVHSAWDAIRLLS